jgi:hypothetical protein
MLRRRKVPGVSARSRGAAAAGKERPTNSSWRMSRARITPSASDRVSTPFVRKGEPARFMRWSACSSQPSSIAATRVPPLAGPAATSGR